MHANIDLNIYVGSHVVTRIHKHNINNNYNNNNKQIY